MSAIARWVLEDVNSGETWTMPINPDRASSPLQDRSIATAYGVKTSRPGEGIDRVRSFMTPSDAKEWTWGGVIRTKDHYDQLAYWGRKERKVRVSDHLGRTFEALMQSFAPDDLKSATTPWRLRYEMTALVLRRIT